MFLPKSMFFLTHTFSTFFSSEETILFLLVVSLPTEIRKTERECGEIRAEPSQEGLLPTAAAGPAQNKGSEAQLMCVNVASSPRPILKLTDVRGHGHVAGADQLLSNACLPPCTHSRPVPCGRKKLDPARSQQ